MEMELSDKDIKNALTKLIATTEIHFEVEEVMGSNFSDRLSNPDRSNQFGVLFTQMVPMRGHTKGSNGFKTRFYAAPVKPFASEAEKDKSVAYIRFIFVEDGYLIAEVTEYKKDRKGKISKVSNDYIRAVRCY